MANDYTALFNAIDIQLGASLRKAGFTRTLVGRVIGTVDATYGEYLVSYQTSQFSATSRNNIAYRVGDLVYVAYTNGDSNLGFQIIGKVSTNVQEKVDLLNSALERYTSLGDFSLEPKDDTKLIFKPTEKEPKNIVYQEIILDKLDLLDPNSETFDSFKRNLIISPKILCNLYVQPQTLSQEYIIDYGVEFTLEFNTGNQVEDALDQVDANGHDFSKYQRIYTFNIDKMVGQPLSYVTNGFMHQYAIFNIEKPENLVRVVSIRYYAIFNSGSYIETPRVSFGSCTICAAIDKNIDINYYYSVALNSTDNISVIRNDQTLQLSTQFRFKDEECNPSNLEYYWFIEDLTVRAKDKKKYNSYGGEGWRCLNKKENIEKDNNNNLFTVEDWVPGSSTLVVDRDLANLYENRFKCCVYYNNGIIVSPVFTVINLNEQNKLRVKLTSKVRSYKWKNEGEQDADPALYDDSNLNRYVNSLDIGLTDTAVIIADLVNTPDTFNSSEVQYVWQKIDSLDQSSWFIPNGKDDSFTYLYGSEIIKNVTIKCGIWIGEQYYGAASVTLESIDDDLRARIANRENLFNTITNNGKYQGIYYFVADGSDSYKAIDARDIANYNPETIDLFINASRLQVGDNNNIIFLADKYKKDVKIAGFTVNERAIFNNKSEVDKTDPGAYFGVDGLAIGDNNSYIKILKNKNSDKWELNITGNITATSLNLGNLKIPSDNLEADISGIEASIGNLQDQIDGTIDTYSEVGLPTLFNKPYTDWSYNGTVAKHISDIYICQDGTYVIEEDGKYRDFDKNKDADTDKINASGWTFRFNAVVDEETKEVSDPEWILLADSNMPYIYDTLAKQSGDIFSITQNEYVTIEENIETQVVDPKTGETKKNTITFVKTYKREQCPDGKPSLGEEPISITLKDSKSNTVLTNAGIGTYTDPTGENVNKFFQVDSSGLLMANNAIINGTIYATAGKIGGFSLEENVLSLSATTRDKSYFGIDTRPKTGTGENEPGIWLGGTGGFENAVFSVDKAGNLKATSADITGTIAATSGSIGGFQIESNALFVGKPGEKSSSLFGIDINDGIWLGSKNSKTGAVFSVDKTGYLTAQQGLIGDLEIFKNEVEWNNYIDDEGIHLDQGVLLFIPSKTKLEKGRYGLSIQNFLKTDTKNITFYSIQVGNSPSSVFLPTFNSFSLLNSNIIYGDNRDIIVSQKDQDFVDNMFLSTSEGQRYLGLVLSKENDFESFSPTFNIKITNNTSSHNFMFAYEVKGSFKDLQDKFDKSEIPPPIIVGTTTGYFTLTINSGWNGLIWTTYKTPNPPKPYYFHKNSCYLFAIITDVQVGTSSAGLTLGYPLKCTIEYRIVDLNNFNMLGAGSALISPSNTDSNDNNFSLGDTGLIFNGSKYYFTANGTLSAQQMSAIRADINGTLSAKTIYSYDSETEKNIDITATIKNLAQGNNTIVYQT